MNIKLKRSDLPASRRYTLFWLLTLMSLLPALRSEVLFPTDWLDILTNQFLSGAIENPFSWLVIALAVLAVWLAPDTNGRLRWLVGATYLMILAAAVIPSSLIPGLDFIYAIMAFTVLIAFLVHGRANSFALAIFVILALLYERIDSLLTLPILLVFFFSILAGRIVVEAFRQNLPMLRQLGRSNLLKLSSKTALLWWPMLFFIFAGLWLSESFSTLTENTLYTQNYVTPHCFVDEVGERAVLACSPERLGLGRDDAIVLNESAFRRLPEPDNAFVLKQCVLRSYDYIEVPNEPPGLPFQCPADTQTAAETGEVAEVDEPSFSLTRLGFFDSAYRSINRDYDEADWQMRRDVNAVRYRARGDISRARTEAEGMFDIVPRTTGMQTRDCDFLEVKCGASNFVIKELNAAYSKARQNAYNDYKVALYDIQESAGGQVEPFMQGVESALAGAIEDARELSISAVARIESATKLLHQIFVLLLAIAVIKSLLYVFSRVIFDKHTGIDVDMMDAGVSLVQGQASHHQEVEIASDYPYDIYYKSNYQPLGPAARFSVPQWFKSWVARMRYGAWNMSRVEMPMSEGAGLTFNATQAEHLVDWHLTDGEEVVINYDNFVAINENIELNTVFSLRVSTLLLGRIVFHTARCTGGPGRLILRTRGKPATAKQLRQGIPAARLIAWNRNARFSVDSHLTPQDIFFNGFNLKRSVTNEDADQGILIVEADARGGSVLVGSLRFVRNFLLPF